MRRIIAALGLIVLTLAPALGQTVSPADQSTVQGVISDQLQAFRADDGPLAYGFAAPVIKQIFPSPDVFMDMVKRGYQPVYRPQSFRFGQVEPDSAGHLIQHVTILGPDGFTYDAIYTMERQPDGSWQISGCRLVKDPGLST
jgi:hypothetical protein